ncbi:MAG TPA: glutathione peroxidase [Jatrophihabitans sp.]|jgi:glutathione peroxidase|nr:glutathione peroxidase [Jatrophihabitans sp.]
MSDLLGLPVTTLQGEATTFGELSAGKTALVVNVASRCGLTPQYAKLEALHEELGAQGFTVIGFPCNQFHGQEPGSAEEIAEFCSATYGVTFPMSNKIDVNGPARDPIYTLLTDVEDASGHSGDIRWNFEKFVVTPDGTIATRFSPRTEPDAPEVRAAITAALP